MKMWTEVVGSQTDRSYFYAGKLKPKELTVLMSGLASGNAGKTS
jgi:hypothetical protein